MKAYYVWLLNPAMKPFETRHRWVLAVNCLVAYEAVSTEMEDGSRIIAVTTKHPDTRPYDWWMHTWIDRGGRIDGVSIVAPIRGADGRLYPVGVNGASRAHLPLRTARHFHH